MALAAFFSRAGSIRTVRVAVSCLSFVVKTVPEPYLRTYEWYFILPGSIHCTPSTPVETNTEEVS